MDCAYRDDCRLYVAVSGLAELTRWLDSHCLNDPERCERLRRTLAEEPVPDDLLPDGNRAGARRAIRPFE